MTVRKAGLAAILGLLGACRPPVPPPPCQARSLSGLWRDAADPSYVYRVEDLGSRVLARPTAAAEGTAVADAIIELHRGVSELSGAVRQTGIQAFPDGTRRSCTVEFAVRVLACPPGRLEMQVEQSGAVGPDCRRVRAGDPDLARHAWVRE
jgi:hypothetical protein